MNEMIWTANVRQDKYVELVKERDRLRKEAFQCRQEYIRVFGELILKVLEDNVNSLMTKGASDANAMQLAIEKRRRLEDTKKIFEKFF